jgi:hypothetical protein
VKSAIFRAIALQYLAVLLGFIWWSSEKTYIAAHGFQLTNGMAPGMANTGK